METTNTNNIRSFQRFFDEDREVVYNLFDAFIAKTILEGKAIDFSKSAVDYYGQVEFATLEDENGQPILFSELLCGKKGAGDYKKCVEHIINAPAAVLRELLKNADWKAAHKGELVLVAHLHWLWSLGLSGVKTSCGKFGKYADIKEDWTGALNAYNLEDGLWYAHISAMGLKKELLLVYSILHRFMTWPNKPEFKSVDEIKSAMVDFVFKTLEFGHRELRRDIAEDRRLTASIQQPHDGHQRATLDEFAAPEQRKTRYRRRKDFQELAPIHKLPVARGAVRGRRFKAFFFESLPAMAP